MSLVLVASQDRPAIVSVGPSVVYVGVHDQWYLTQRREWKRKLREAHPDFRVPTPRVYPCGRLDPHKLILHGLNSAQSRYFRNGTVFRRVMTQYRKWEAEERKYYARLGLRPPRQ